MKLVCRLYLGHPTIEQSAKTAEYYVAGGCDIIEIVVPARNPFMETDNIAQKMAETLSVCDNYFDYLDTVTETRRFMPHVPVIITIYENTIKEIGVKRFVDFMYGNNIRDITLAGTGDDKITDHLRGHDFRISGIVSEYMRQDEITAAKALNGFVFMPAKLSDNQFPPMVDRIHRLREHGIDREIYCFGGITCRRDFNAVKVARADGAVLDDSVIDGCKDTNELMNTIAALKAD